MSNNIDRREFLKRLGIGTSLTGLALAGCKNAEKTLTGTIESQEGEMTYRVNPKTGEKV